jgi:hypothetical protein
MHTRIHVAARAAVLSMALALLSTTIEAQQAPPKQNPLPAGISAIKEADLKRDLYVLGGDGMRGREAGTTDEMRASMWIADQLRKIGLEPMGDDGTYFQWWEMRRTRLSVASSVIRIGDRTLTLWKDAAPSGNGASDISAPTVWAGTGSDTTIDVRGKVAVAQLIPAAAAGRQSNINSPEYRATTAAITAEARGFTQRGAVAVVLVADATGDIAFEGVSAVRSRGTYNVDGPAVPRNTGRGGARGSGLTDSVVGARGQGGAGRGGGAGGGGRGGAANAAAPVLLVHGNMLDFLRAGGQQATIRLNVESFTYPSVNIVGRVRGTDPKLRDEYVLFSGHQDHDGVRYPIDGDSIWNGADDNGSVCVAMLGIARAFVKQPGKRSALFVYHGAEERGLLGSRYHAMHPVVPLGQIVAVLNGDMIGRNNPDSASLMGIQPPHRNSIALVNMALEANARTGKFILDSLWDRPTHPEGWYFRSDHVPYADVGVPAIFFSTNLHPDYHTPRDEPSRIDYPKLKRMTDWMYLTGWIVANTTERPKVDH